MPAFITDSLASQHQRNDFSCGEVTLDDYLKKYAGQDQKRKEAAVFVYENQGIVLGYYTLSAIHVDVSAFPEGVLKRLRLSSYPNKPATLLGRLAVDSRFKNEGVGKRLLVDALRRSYFQSTQIGSLAVVVDALNAAASSFYQHFGFIPLQGYSKRLLLPMKTIKPLFDS